MALFLLLGPAPIAQLIEKTAPGATKASGEYDLTDQNRFESQTFIHEGKSQRQMEEECAKLKDPSACRGNGKTKFLGVDSGIVQAVSKAYSIVGAMVGMSGGAMDFEVRAEADAAPAGGEVPAEGGAAATPPAGEEVPAEGGAANEGSGEKKKDYCALIPAVGETLAMFMQQTSQQNLQQQPVTQSTPQKELLYRAARSHQTRAKTAKIQGTVWVGTAGCYAAYMAAGGIVIDWKVIAKAGAAAFLGTFWLSEAKQQEKYYKEVTEIADELPGRGDCNPHTQNDCYCAQPETQYDPTYCLPQLHKKAVATDSFRVPCADKDMNPDAKCDCITQEACFDSEYFSELKGPGFVQFANSSSGKDIRNLTRGSLNGGNLAAGANGSAAKSRKLLGDLAKKVNNSPNLNSSGKSALNGFEKFGVPKPLARLLASRPTTSAGKRKYASISSGLSDGKPNYKKKYTSGNKVLSFSRGGNGRIGPGSQKGGASNPFNKFKKKKSARGGAKTLRFAQKAQNAAQISRNKEKPLFEIISRRYQVSGWKRLEIQ